MYVVIFVSYDGYVTNIVNNKMVSVRQVVCLELATILILIGIFVYFWQSGYYSWGPSTYGPFYPFRDWGMPLITIGCIFLVGAIIIGYLEGQQKGKEAKPLLERLGIL